MAANMLILFVVAAVHSVSGACPYQWITNSAGDACYFISTQQESWMDALHSCQRQGAKLAQIDTPEENTFLKQKLTELHPGPEWQYWIDGTDTTAEGHWLWAGSGQVLDFKDWFPGEPNNLSFGDEDCLTMYPRYQFQWNDDACNKHFAYICERK